MKIHEILAVVEEIEKNNPIDFADLHVDEQKIRELTAQKLSVHFDQLKEQLPSPEDREVFWVSMLAHQVLENTVLNARMLMLNPTNQDENSIEQTNTLIDGLRKKK